MPPQNFLRKKEKVWGGGGKGFWGKKDFFTLKEGKKTPEI